MNSFNETVLFLGHGVEYWTELDARAKKENLDTLLDELIQWKHRALMAEARLTELKRIITE